MIDFLHPFSNAVNMTCWKFHYTQTNYDKGTFDTLNIFSLCVKALLLFLFLPNKSNQLDKKDHVLMSTD